MTEHADPFFGRWAQHQRPPLTRYRRAAVRIEHAALHDELATIDAELETLSARRRAVLDRLGAVRADRWPRDAQCHRRRRARVDEIPLPPAPSGAEPLGGVDLRATCLGLLRRHGPCGLRELHGLLHRHGYRIDGPRAVQGLADAMAYEVRQGRAVRIERGVYGAVAAGPATRSTDPLPWEDPDVDRPQIDPVVLDDPERWGGGAWPAAPERPGSQVRPPDRYDPSTLDEDIQRARSRASALVELRPAAEQVPPPSADESAATDTGQAEHHVGDHWERFVDESVPTVRNWAQHRRAWAQREAERERRREEGEGRSHLWGGDPEPGGP